MKKISPVRLVVHLVVCCLLFGAFTAPTHAQDQENGWVYWEQAFPYFTSSQQGDEWVDPLVSQEDLDLLYNYIDDPIRPLSEEERRALESVQPALDLLRQAGNADYSDAGIDFSEGFMTLLPHLSGMRAGARLLTARARASIADGDIDAAMDYLNTLGAITPHSSSDGSIVSSLVSGAIFRLTDTNLEHAIGTGLIDQERAKTLLESMELLSLEDPFNFSGALFTERDTMLQYFDDLIEIDGEGRDLLLEEFASFGIEGAPTGYTTEDLLAEREIASGLLDQLVEGFNDPDRERGRALIEDVSSQVELLAQEGYDLIGLMMPSIDRVSEMRDLLESDVAARLRQLDGVARGRIKPEALLNAAIIWLPAGHAASKLDINQQGAALTLLNLPPEACLPMPQTGVMGDLAGEPPEPWHEDDALEAWQEAMNNDAAAILVSGLDAASIANADFSVNKEQRPFIQPEYLGELRAVGRVLLASAAARRLAWEASEGEEMTADQRQAAGVDALLGVEEIAAVLTLIRHLHDDPAIAHAILGAALLEAAALQVEAFANTIKRREAAGIDNPKLDRAILQRLRSAMETVPRSDAFGLRAGLIADREHLIDTWSRRSPTTYSEQAVKTFVRFLNNRDADQIAVLLASYDARGPIGSIAREDRMNLEDVDREKLTFMIERYASLPPLSPLVRMDDVIPLAPSMRGDGIPRGILISDIRTALARTDDPTAIHPAMGRLNLAMIVDVRGAVRRGYGRIGDADKALRSRPIFPAPAEP